MNLIRKANYFFNIILKVSNNYSYAFLLYIYIYKVEILNVICRRGIKLNPNRRMGQLGEGDVIGPNVSGSLYAFYIWMND